VTSFGEGGKKRGAKKDRLYPAIEAKGGEREENISRLVQTLKMDPQGTEGKRNILGQPERGGRKEAQEDTMKNPISQAGIKGKRSCTALFPQCGAEKRKKRTEVPRKGRRGDPRGEKREGTKRFDSFSSIVLDLGKKSKVSSLVKRGKSK